MLCYRGRGVAEFVMLCFRGSAVAEFVMTYVVL